MRNVIIYAENPEKCDEQGVRIVNVVDVDSIAEIDTNGIGEFDHILPSAPIRDVESAQAWASSEYRSIYVAKLIWL